MGKKKFIPSIYIRGWRQMPKEYVESFSRNEKFSRLYKSSLVVDNLERGEERSVAR